MGNVETTLRVPRDDGNRHSADRGQAAFWIFDADVPDLRAASEMKRRGGSDDFALSYASDVVAVDLHPDAKMARVYAVIRGNRGQGFRKHCARAAVKQAERLRRSVIDGHRSFEEIGADLGNLDSEMADRASSADAVDLL